MATSSNSEVSKKLRAAIRAKLEELGVYVDDELPDYIMVMVANKKERRQMKEDLNLFLGKNTDAFVEWLFDIFERLQSASKGGEAVTSTTSAAPSAPIEKRDTKKAESPPRTKAAEKKKEKLADRKRGGLSSKAEIEKEKERERERELREREKDRERERKERERRDAERRAEAERREREDRERRHRERERRERDEREREKDREKEKEREREREREREKDKERKRESDKRRRVSPVRTARRISSPEDQRRQRIHSRHDESDHDEKVAISPSHSPPRVTVASKVVMVNRNVKPQVQPQPDKKAAKGRVNMFMKAVSAASASAGYGGFSVQLPKEVAPVISRKRTIGGKVPGLNFQTIQFDTEEEESASEDDENEEMEPVLKKRVVAPSSPAKPSAPEPFKRNIVQPKIDDKKNIQFTITLDGGKGEAARRTLKRQGAASPSVPDGDDDVADDADTIRVASPRKAMAVVAEKRPRIHDRITRVTRLEAHDDAGDECSIAVSPPHNNLHQSGDWDGLIHFDEEDETSDDEAAIDAVLAMTRASRMQSMHDDGETIPPTHQLSRGQSFAYDVYDPQYASPVSSSASYVPAYVPTPLNHTSPAATASVAATTVTAPLPTKLQERCRFWPLCKLEQCVYVHPSRNCMNFPKCTFGNRCLYVHPKCKFDGRCTNVSCQFTHYLTSSATGASVADKAGHSLNSSPSVTAPTAAAPAAAAASTPAVKDASKIEPDVPLVPEPVAVKPLSAIMAMTACRFGARCTNPKCAFKHPKMPSRNLYRREKRQNDIYLQECRFGKSCYNSSCFFYHPPAGRFTTGSRAPATTAPAPQAPGGPSKFKWTAGPVEA